MEQKDTTTYKINSGSNTTYTIQVVSSKKSDSNFLTHPTLISIVFPLLATLFMFLVARFLTRKKEKADLKKVETETEKNQAEILQIKSSFHPIVISSLQAVQNEIFKDKINSLRELIKSKSDIFNIEDIYHEREGFIVDEYDYYQNVYCSISGALLEKIKKNSLDNSGLFPSQIRHEFQNLTEILFEIYDIQKREFSKRNENMPSDAEKNLKAISKKFDKVIDMMREDLHLDNRFIHDFISEHQSKL